MFSLPENEPFVSTEEAAPLPGCPPGFPLFSRTFQDLLIDDLVNMTDRESATHLDIPL